MRTLKFQISYLTQQQRQQIQLNLINKLLEESFLAKHIIITLANFVHIIHLFC